MIQSVMGIVVKQGLQVSNVKPYPNNGRLNFTTQNEDIARAVEQIAKEVAQGISEEVAEKISMEITSKGS